MLCDLIVKQQATIYVSGKAKNMPKSVNKAFEDIIDLHGHQPIKGQ